MHSARVATASPALDHGRLKMRYAETRLRYVVGGLAACIAYLRRISGALR